MSDRFDDNLFDTVMSTGMNAPLAESRLLLVGGEDGTRFRVASDLKQAGAAMEFAGSADEAVTSLNESQDDLSPFDLVLIDASSLGPAAIDTVNLLRDIEYAGPVLVMSRDATRKQVSQFFEAGCDELIAKRDDPAELISTATTLVNREKARRFGLANPDEVTSELSAYPELLMMLRRFVSNLPESVESVLSAQREQDLARLRDELDRVKRNATSHGYLEIRASAVAAQQELEESKKLDTQELVEAIDDLVDVCRRATASPSQPPPPSGPGFPPSG